jgi:hypothetical protein
MNVDVALSLFGKYAAAADLGTAESNLAYSYLQRLLDGTGAGQINRWFQDTRSLNASANENLDLAGGGLVDEFGVALTFARVKVLMIACPSTNVGDIRITRPATNGVPIYLAAGDGQDVAPGEAKLLICRSDATAIVVTAGTGDLINVANQSGAQANSYSVFIAGSSA